MVQRLLFAVASGLEVDVTRELEVSRTVAASGAGDRSEVAGTERSDRITERNLIPDVEAINLEYEVAEVLREREAAAQPGIQILGTRIAEVQGLRARCIADEVDR